MARTRSQRSTSETDDTSIAHGIPAAPLDGRTSPTVPPPSTIPPTSAALPPSVPPAIASLISPIYENPYSLSQGDQPASVLVSNILQGSNNYNSLGLSIHGCGEQAVSLFHMMLNEGLIPDEVAFSVILTACSRSGLVEDGRQLFHLMKNEYSIAPSQDHYACMVDLLSRSGRLKEAYEILSSMPMEPSSASWGALLGACKLHCDVELGELVASRLIELEPQNAGNYVLLSNIYAATDRWLDVSLVRSKMREKSVKKIPGRSWIRSHG
ncbi:putative pentatricopeptide repeat-containing protein At5g37570 [Humulus lupulus]|uniref:putative pentatricopeptide repeat-containing protein At5g37570 n=1 Tax=Humulus lupulus TaxID=3486 RepID=UPI002B40BFED|nr:putative pentatricopeptide repeat-containing protein At5g37570 [Humulus lupulus]